MDHGRAQRRGHRNAAAVRDVVLHHQPPVPLQLVRLKPAALQLRHKCRHGRAHGPAGHGGLPHGRASLRVFLLAVVRALHPWPLPQVVHPKLHPGGVRGAAQGPELGSPAANRVGDDMVRLPGHRYPAPLRRHQQPVGGAADRRGGYQRQVRPRQQHQARDPVHRGGPQDGARAADERDDGGPAARAGEAQGPLLRGDDPRAAHAAQRHPGPHRRPAADGEEHERPVPAVPQQRHRHRAPLPEPDQQHPR
mmetsp:Transcript_18126/g.46431  ORF Transcript_18126/g.46431 Transcript_18126/m.46431 type:complete len:250 (+) Transcript_18126:3-752(+)